MKGVTCGGECDKRGEHALECECRTVACQCKCHRCKDYGLKLYCLTEDYHEYLVCKECAMEYHAQHEKFILSFMNRNNLTNTA